jgi:hypothetical protein
MAKIKSETFESQTETVEGEQATDNIITTEQVTTTITTEQQEPPKINFPYNNRTQDSYNSKGLRIPEDIKNQDQEAKFLGFVDPQQIQNIERRITRFVRVLAPDLLSGSKKHVIKEFMYYYENWYGVDWRGEQVPPVTDHIEGKYFEQDTKPAPFVNGRPTGKFTRTGQHEIHYLHYNKTTVEQIVNASDSDQDEINYVIKVGNSRLSPIGGYTYEQFRDLPFPELIKLARATT